MDELLSTKETSELLNIPVGTLRWWRHTGEGPRSFKLGAKTVRYRRSDVEAWLTEQYERASASA